jgi:hypothetical protein
LALVGIRYMIKEGGQIAFLKAMLLIVEEKRILGN